MGATHGMFFFEIILELSVRLTFASPGRWFAALQLKLMLAYIVSHYDIQPLKHRPLNRNLGQNIIPPLSGTINVKRRKGC